MRTRTIVSMGDADMHLVSTWLSPVVRTCVTCTAAAVDITTSNKGIQGQFVTLVLFFNAMLATDMLPVSHVYMSDTSRKAGYMLLYWLVYVKAARVNAWELDSTSWWVFGISCGILASTYTLERYLRFGIKENRLWGLLYLTGILLLPNAANTQTIASLWEYGFRCFLFLFSAWFCMFVSLISNTQHNWYYLFNQFTWTLVVHRYLVPLVGVVWMRAVLQMTTAFSTRKPIDSISEALVTDESGAGGTGECEEDSGSMGEPSLLLQVSKRPSKMFQTAELDIPSSHGTAPRRQRMLKKWNPSVAQQPPIHTGRRRPAFGAPGAGAPQTDAEQLLKLQQLAHGVDAV